MNEICLSFGPARHLVGTLALPGESQSQPTGFILLNAGVVHRIGPHRINVKLARQLARSGFPTLRFDLSGQGDSRSTANAAPFERQAVADIRFAMDHMEKTAGVRQFVIAGICSGAHHGVATAAEDTRVIGLWMLDSYAYPTVKTNLVRYRRRLEGRLVPGLVAGVWRRLRSLPTTVVRRFKPAVINEYWRSAPTRKDYAATLQSLVDRGVDIYMLHSGSLLDAYNYDGQFREAFKEPRLIDAVRCEFAPHIDHTVTSLDVQKLVTATICEWANTFRVPDAVQVQPVTSS